MSLDSTRLASVRARRRRDSAGAAMFIVAVTLGLLAAMGVYGMAAASMDVRAAGQERQAAQNQRAAEMAIVETAQSLGPGNASPVLAAIRLGGTTPCRSTTTHNCIVLGAKELQQLSGNTWATFPDDTVTKPFSTKSMGEVTAVHPPYVRVELSNPIEWPAAGSAASAGYQVGGQTGSMSPMFSEVRATVYIEMRPNGFLAAPDTVVTGRGRLLVGPYIPYKN